MRINDLETSKSGRVFVYNKTDPIGTVCMTIVSGEGVSVALRIPKTWVPVEISEQVDKQGLLKSHSFRQAVFNGTLDLVPVDDALEVLESKEGRSEYNSMRERMRIIASGATQATSSNEVEDAQEEAQRLSPQVIEIMENDTLTDESRYNSLRTIEAQLSVDDCKYIARKASHANLRKYVEGLSPKKK